MKKVLRIATALAFAGVSANAYSLWEVNSESNSMNNLCETVYGTNCPDVDEYGGPIFPYADEATGGTSTTNIPDEVKGDETGSTIGSWFRENNGTVEFTTSPGAEYPLVGLGFKWRDPATGDKETYTFNPLEVPEEGFGNLAKGLSLCYASDADMFIEISVYPGNKYEYNALNVALENTSGESKHVKFSWEDDFAQYPWDDNPPISGGYQEYLKYSQAIQFVFKGAAGQTQVAHLGIGGIGGYDDPDDCANQNVPVRKIIQAAALNMVQYGRMLTFTGLNSTVEIISMQGKLVSKADISDNRNTMSLNGLATGIYMVRANNMTQKIIVK